jgi:hypothetical protein
MLATSQIQTDLLTSTHSVATLAGQPMGKVEQSDLLRADDVNKKSPAHVIRLVNSSFWPARVVNIN